VAHESFDGALVVKSLGREAEETHRFDGRATALRDANVAVGRTRGMFDPVIEAIPNLGTLAVLAVGTSRAAHGESSVADVVQVAYLFSLLAFPVRALGWVLGELPRSAVGWARVESVLHATGRLSFGTGELPGTGAAHVVLDHVEYAHVDADGDVVPALVDISLDVRPGTTVAVVGPTGSGKSTLTGLLVRLVDPDRGAVCLDGADLTTLRAGEVARSTALVPQHTFLFDDSVRGNVTLGDEGLQDDDDHRVWAALRTAQVDGFVAGLPHGLDTQVGERGATLSGGQRQRIALARALVRRPRLLVLDDATSAVDPQVEAAILAGLRSADTDSTVVVVAYRKATIALADQDVFVSGGRVVDVGTHHDLSARRPAYRNLVDAYERDAAERAAAMDAEEALS
jgi:ABC-type multidrug transport system fused ATPase/permease subunit